MATARPVCSVYQFDKPAVKAKNTVTLPHVFSAPLRADLVRLVHTGVNKNKRQAMAVKDEVFLGRCLIFWERLATDRRMV